MNRNGEEETNERFLRVVKTDESGKQCKTICPSCGREIAVRIGLLGKLRAVWTLKRRFNRCDKCGRFVCDDCYVIASDNQIIEGMCVDCARELGIIGMTTTEILNGFERTK